MHPTLPCPIFRKDSAKSAARAAQCAGSSEQMRKGPGTLRGIYPRPQQDSAAAWAPKFECLRHCQLWRSLALPGLPGSGGRITEPLDESSRKLCFERAPHAGAVATGQTPRLPRGASSIVSRSCAQGRHEVSHFLGRILKQRRSQSPGAEKIVPWTLPFLDTKMQSPSCIAMHSAESERELLAVHLWVSVQQERPKTCKVKGAWCSTIVPRITSELLTAPLEFKYDVLGAVLLHCFSKACLCDTNSDEIDGLQQYQEVPGKSTTKLPGCWGGALVPLIQLLHYM